MEDIPPMETTPKKLDDISTILPDIGLDVENELIYKWSIPSWNAIRNTKKYHGEIFNCGSSRWYLTYFRTSFELSTFK